MLLKGVTATLFGLAIIFAVIRTTFRQRSSNYQRLPLDDVFLCFACVLLCAGTSLFYALMPALYGIETKFNGLSVTDRPPDVIRKVLWLQKTILAYQVMTWTSIFCVKASFLCFFRRLVDRLRPLLILWKTATGITTISYVVIFCDLFVGCPHFGMEISKSPSIHCQICYCIDRYLAQCFQGSGVTQDWAIDTLTICMDVISDLMS